MKLIKVVCHVIFLKLILNVWDIIQIFNRLLEKEQSDSYLKPHFCSTTTIYLFIFFSSFVLLHFISLNYVINNLSQIGSTTIPFRPIT